MSGIMPRRNSEEFWLNFSKKFSNINMKQLLSGTIQRLT
ncbi:hypothetical protein L579_3614 [Pantoea sp. AS-PWVM4]|nr:hypothetical protein L579_3614 [Pantoea sp. AS-PWVM4]